MLLKKYSYLLLAGLLSTAFVACDDDGDGVTDDTKPTVNLTSPTADQISDLPAGSTINLMGSVTDNRDLETVTVTLMAPGQTAPSDDWTWTFDEDDFSGNTLELNQTIEIPFDAAQGTYILTITAQDDGENVTVQPFNINVTEAESNASFTVTAPANTPETAEIYLVGLNNTDDTNTYYRLTRDATNGKYTGNFMFPTGTAETFYFRIKSDDAANADKFREVNTDCSMPSDDWVTANRTFTGTDTEQEMSYTISAWQGMATTQGGCVSTGG